MEKSLFNEKGACTLIEVNPLAISCKWRFMASLGQVRAGWGVAMVERELESGGIEATSGLNVSTSKGWFHQPLAEEEEKETGEAGEGEGDGLWDPWQESWLVGSKVMEESYYSDFMTRSCVGE